MNLILKADVQGSLEPIINEINNLGKGEIAINILYAETGNISENDVLLASSSQAIVIGFSVQADVAARRLAEKEGVSIRLYDIIYRLIEDVEKALKGMLAPEFTERPIGKAVVLQVFSLSKGSNIAGCRVTKVKSAVMGRYASRVARISSTKVKSVRSNMKRKMYAKCARALNVASV